MDISKLSRNQRKRNLCRREVEEIINTILDKEEKILWEGSPSNKIIEKLYLYCKVFVIVSVILLIITLISIYLISKFEFILFNILCLVVSISFIIIIYIEFTLINEINSIYYSFYFISNKRILEIYCHYTPALIISLKFENIDKIIVTNDFRFTSEFIVLRRNKKYIRNIEFHAIFLKENVQDSYLYLEDGKIIAFEKNRRIDNKLIFRYLEDWKYVKSILKDYLNDWAKLNLFENSSIDI